MISALLLITWDKTKLSVKWGCGKDEVNQDSRARTKVRLVSPASARAKLDPLYSKLQAF